jgi:predicted 2-oxoglutarate/Fe(II)-dependent dioxygenase YbiX
MEYYDNPLIMIPGGVSVIEKPLDYPVLRNGTWVKMASESSYPGEAYSNLMEALMLFAVLADTAYAELKNRIGKLETPGISRTQILRYTEGQSHALHVDDQFKLPERIGRTKVALNLLNQFGCLTWDMSDDFEGGELVFPNQNLVIQPKRNMVVMWPANRHFPHEVLPVKRGTRYTYVRHFYVTT